MQHVKSKTKNAHLWALLWVCGRGDILYILYGIYVHLVVGMQNKQNSIIRHCYGVIANCESDEHAFRLKLQLRKVLGKVAYCCDNKSRLTTTKK